MPSPQWSGESRGFCSPGPSRLMQMGSRVSHVLAVPPVLVLLGGRGTFGLNVA